MTRTTTVLFEVEGTTAEITLTKQAAARRLISSAVILARAEGDPLAIHLLAASALNLLRDLLRKRGRNYVDRGIICGLFEAAQRLDPHVADFAVQHMDDFHGA